MEVDLSVFYEKTEEDEQRRYRHKDKQYG